MNDWHDRLLDAGLRQLGGERPPDQAAVILHRLQTELPPLAAPPPPAAPRLLGAALLGAAAALLFAFVLARATAPAPAVLVLELSAQRGSVACTAPATATEPPQQLLLGEGQRGAWRAQVGSRLHGGADGVELLVRSFGELHTTKDTRLEVRSMEFTMRNGAIATGALTFAVVAGVATWHTLSGVERAEAGRQLRIEAQAPPAGEAERAQIARLEQQNRDLQQQLEQLQTQLARRPAEPVPAAPAQPEPETPTPPATGAPAFADARFAELLASIDWNEIGAANAAMGPKLAALMAALDAGEEPDMAAAVEIQQLNSKLLGMVPKLLQAELPGFGPNGVFTHPLVAANSLAGMLQQSGQALTAAQQATLQQLVAASAAENQGVAELPREFELERLQAEAALKDRFYQQLADSLTPAQRALMYPDGAGRTDGSSLFSTGLMWSVYDRPVPAGDAGEFARAASSGLAKELGLDDERAAAVRAVIQRVAAQSVDWHDKGSPIELRGGGQAFLRSGRGEKALAVQLRWMRELTASGLLTAEQQQKLRQLPRIWVPVPR